MYNGSMIKKMWYTSNGTLKSTNFKSLDVVVAGAVCVIFLLNIAIYKLYNVLLYLRNAK